MHVTSMEGFPEFSFPESRSPELSSCSILQSLEQCFPISPISLVISREALKCYQGLKGNPEYETERPAFMLVPSVRCMRDEYYSAFLWMDASHAHSTIHDLVRCFDSDGRRAPQHIIKVDDSIRKGAPTSLMTLILQRVIYPQDS